MSWPYRFFRALLERAPAAGSWSRPTAGSSGSATGAGSPSPSSRAASGRVAAPRRSTCSSGAATWTAWRGCGRPSSWSTGALDPVFGPRRRVLGGVLPAGPPRRRSRARCTCPTWTGPSAFSRLVAGFATPALRAAPDAGRPDRPPAGVAGRWRVYWAPSSPPPERFDARPQSRLPGRRLGHPLPAGHQGPAEGDAAPRRQADHPVRRRGGGRRRHRAGHHRHLVPEAGDRGPLRPQLRAGAPARGEGRHREAAPGPPHQRPRADRLRPPEGAAGPGSRGAHGQGPDRPRAVRRHPARRRADRRPPGASAS